MDKVGQDAATAIRLIVIPTHRSRVHLQPLFARTAEVWTEVVTAEVAGTITVPRCSYKRQLEPPVTLSFYKLPVSVSLSRQRSAGLLPENADVARRDSRANRIRTGGTIMGRKSANFPQNSSPLSPFSPTENFLDSSLKIRHSLNRRFFR